MQRRRQRSQCRRLVSNLKVRKYTKPATPDPSVEGATLPLPCASAALVAQTLPLPCVSAVLVAKAAPFIAVSPCKLGVCGGGGGGALLCVCVCVWRWRWCMCRCRCHHRREAAERGVGRVCLAPSVLPTDSPLQLCCAAPLHPPRRLTTIRGMRAIVWDDSSCAVPRGLSSNTMALITTDCDAMRSLRTKWP